MRMAMNMASGGIRVKKSRGYSTPIGRRGRFLFQPGAKGECLSTSRGSPAEGTINLDPAHRLQPAKQKYGSQDISQADCEEAANF